MIRFPAALVFMAALGSLTVWPSSAWGGEPTAGPLPAVPHGRSTVIGGAIRAVDPVRDQVTLKVFGGRSMKILYDERTQVYRDGVRIPLSDLRPEGHASVETVLDGTNVFAVSIHMLSQSPQGEVQGQVIAYDRGAGLLRVNDALSRQAVEVEVPAGTPLAGQAQAAHAGGVTAAALSAGTLVDVKFRAGGNGRGIADQIAILATPGAGFVFSGKVEFVDLHSGRLTLTDPGDEQSYQLSFDPRLAAARDLHQGSRVTVHADFDGSGYVARAITMN